MISRFLLAASRFFLGFPIGCTFWKFTPLRSLLLPFLRQLLQGFLEENDMVLPWQAHLEAKNKEAQDAVQEQSTETLDVQEQTADGEGMGEGDSEGE
jgi:hypothetical protein